jgi:hypothetical protein
MGIARMAIVLSLWVLTIFPPPLPSVGAQQLVVVDFSSAAQPVPEGWEVLENTGKANAALVREADGQALQLRSEQTSFALQKKVQIALQEYPFVVWQWKVTQLPEGGDFRRSSTDDQAAQLIIAFSERQFLAYIWDSTAPQGLLGEAPAPLFRKIFALVIQSGPRALGTWLTERRNVIDDYTKAFGQAPKATEGVRIQINSQHTKSRAESYWKSILFTSQP